jgi:hypothetical protein
MNEVIVSKKRTSKYANKFANGHTFGSWTVVDGIIHGSPAKMDVRCVCGQIKRADVYTLVSGKSTSCGCVRVGEKAPNWRGINGVGRTTLYTNGRSAVGQISYEDMVNTYVAQSGSCAVTSAPLNLSEAKLVRLSTDGGYLSGNVAWVSPAVATITGHTGINTMTSAVASIITTTNNPNIFEQMGMSAAKEKP